MYRSHVLVCGGTGCTSSGSQKIIDAFESEIKKNGLDTEVAVVKTGCHGLCALGPIMQVYPEGIFYTGLTVENIERIVKEHFIDGKPVKDFIYKETIKGDKFASCEDTAFFKKQKRMVKKQMMIL